MLKNIVSNISQIYSFCEIDELQIRINIKSYFFKLMSNDRFSYKKNSKKEIFRKYRYK